MSTFATSGFNAYLTKGGKVSCLISYGKYTEKMNRNQGRNDDISGIANGDNDISAISQSKEERALRKKMKGTETKVKIDKYESKKGLNVLATRYLDEYLSPKMLERFGECGEWIEFAITENFSKSKVFRANFCKHRFCPMCNMRKAYKDTLKIGTMLEAMMEKEKQEFIFLTLTVPNCKGQELPNVLDKMNEAVKKMFGRKRIKESINGYIRKIEVTTDQSKKITQSWYKKREEYCKKKGLKVGELNPIYNTYHPHMHFILMVGEDYFKKHSKKYIQQAEWLSIWQEVNGSEAVGLDIRKVQNRGQSTAIEEIAKYSAKDSDLYHSQSVFLTFVLALKGRQLITYSGIAKKYAKNWEDGKLDYILDRKHAERRKVQREKGEAPEIFNRIINANWIKRMTRKQREVYQYALRIREMTEDEINEINHCEDIALAKEIERTSE